jgi:amidophosphoribosyltransferase
VRRSIGADSLGYVSLDGLVGASEQPASRLCTACFDGDYPIPLPEEARLGKHLLEDLVRAPGHTPSVDVSGAASGDPGPVSVPADPVAASWGAAGALDRP